MVLEEAGLAKRQPSRAQAGHYEYGQRKEEQLTEERTCTKLVKNLARESIAAPAVAGVSTWMTTVINSHLVGIAARGRKPLIQSADHLVV